MRKRIRSWLLVALRRIADPPPDQRTVIRKLNDALVDLATREDAAKAAYMERVAELVEARQMAGSGPWTASSAAVAQTDRIIDDALQRFGRPHQPVLIRESANAITAQGIYGDIELALQNVEWRREVNLSWMEFSRWGIQQIILISRLYYVKNPIIRRLIDVCAAYVFARGVEVSSSDEAANDVLKDFFERNRTTLGQNALNGPGTSKGLRRKYLLRPLRRYPGPGPGQLPDHRRHRDSGGRHGSGRHGQAMALPARLVGAHIRYPHWPVAELVRSTLVSGAWL